MKLKPILVAICVLIGTLGLLGYIHYTRQKSQLVEARTEILELRENLGKTRATILELRENLGKASDNIHALREKVVILENKLEKTRKGSRWDLHNPTFQEVQDFIDEDDTDKNQSIKREYICVDFAADVNSHAMEKGIRCAEVDIRFEAGAHMAVAFETIDKGLIYVEPQNDTIIPELKVGQGYWDVVDKYSEEYKFKETPGDVIQRIIILW